MPISDYQSLMLPVLRLTADRQDHALPEIRERIALQLTLTPEELAERCSSGAQTVFSNRIAWAVQYLKAARTIEPVRRSVYQITERGSSLLQTNPDAISVQLLRQFPEFVEFHGKGANGVDSPQKMPASGLETTETPEESLHSSLKVHHEALADDLLEIIKSGTPAAFERIVVNLLKAMGYGGLHEAAARVVGGSGDCAIDGEVDQDRLGLDTGYVQAKRWQGAVGSPELMKFSGGLTKRHASRGVFITSSRFTDDAVDYVKGLPQRIVLIDGPRLADLMIEYNLGVIPDRTFSLKRLDSAYFENV